MSNLYLFKALLITVFVLFQAMNHSYVRCSCVARWNYSSCGITPSFSVMWNCNAGEALASYKASEAEVINEVRASQLAQASERVGSLIPASQQS